MTSLNKLKRRLIILMWIVSSSILCVVVRSWAFICRYASADNALYEVSIYQMTLIYEVIPAALVIGIAIGNIIGRRVTRSRSRND